MSTVRDLPLFTRNRLHYKPPQLPKRAPPPEIVYDFSKENERTTDNLNPVAETPLPVISTAYTLLIIAFFKSLLGKLLSFPLFRSKEDLSGEVHIENTPELEIQSEPKPQLLSLHNEEKIESTPEPANILPSDLSIMSINEGPTLNLYESMLELDSSEEDIGGGDQYGTNLTITQNYTRNSDWSTLRTHDFSAFTQQDELYSDILKPLDEYDVAISKFYTPFRPVPKAHYTVTDAVLSAIPSSLTNFLKKERDSIQDLITKERTATKPTLVPLSKEQLLVVERHWRAGRSTLTVVSAFSIDITCRDLLTLADRQWLNDNVIDFYLNLVTEQNDLVYCWTTHFFTTLKKNGYKGVARWAKRRKINVMEMNTVVVPINSMNTHWAVAVVDNVLHTISYYDSLSSNGNLPAVELLSHYMLQEAERLNVPAKEYSLHPNMKTPQQQNGYDCGVFTCTVAKCIALKVPLLFSQKDMQNIRRRMAFEIVQKNLLPEGDVRPNL